MASPKARITFLGDSITRGYGLTDISTQSIKYWMDFYLNDALDIALFGYDGYQSAALATPYTTTVLPTYDPTRIKEYLCILGGINDIFNEYYSGIPLSAATLAGRLQSLITNGQNDGYEAIITTIFAASNIAQDETLRTDTNNLITGGGFTTDFTVDAGSDDILGQISGAQNLTYFLDGIHPTSAGNKIRAQLTLASVGQDSGLPLVAICDTTAIISSTDDLIPLNIPFGGTGTRTYLWKVDGVSTGNTDIQPNLGPQPVGDHVLRLESHTTADGTVFVEVPFSVVAAGNIGTGAIDPAFPTAGTNSTTALESSGLSGSVKWFVYDGGGTVDNISGNSADFEAPSSADTSTVKAEEEMWSVPAQVTSNSDNSLTWTSVDGYNAVSVARFTEIGGGFEETLTTAFLATVGNKIAIANSGSGNVFALIVTNSTHIKVNTTGGGDETTLTVAVGDKIALEIGTTKILVKKNGTLVYTTTSSYDSLLSFPIFAFLTMLATISMPRPRFYGDGITLWNSGESVITTEVIPPSVIITAPTVGTTVSGTIAVNAAAQAAAGVTSVQFKVDGNNIGVPDTVSPYTRNLDTTSLSDGSHSLTAVMLTADSETVTSAAVTITVDNTSPTGVITSPVAGAFVEGTITLQTNAADMVGIGGVQYKIDGVNFGDETVAMPFTIDLDTTTIDDGSHTVSAVIRDTAGNSITTPTVHFSVGNNVTGVRVSGGEIGTYQGNDSTLVMRIYLRHTYTTVDGIILLGSNLGDPFFYKAVSCTVAENLVSYSGFAIDPTTNAINNPKDTSYTFALYSNDGTFKSVVYSGLKVPPTTPTTLSAIIAYNT